MRRTISNFRELCDLIKDHKDKGETIVLTPVSWEGWQKKDRKTGGMLREVDKDKVVHIIFDVEVHKDDNAGVAEPG